MGWRDKVAELVSERGQLSLGRGSRRLGRILRREAGLPPLGCRLLLRRGLGRRRRLLVSPRSEGPLDLGALCLESLQVIGAGPLPLFLGQTHGVSKGPGLANGSLVSIDALGPALGEGHLGDAHLELLHLAGSELAPSLLPLVGGHTVFNALGETSEISLRKRLGTVSHACR